MKIEVEKLYTEKKLEKVMLNSPSNNTALQNLYPAFTWEQMPGANEFEIHIAKNSTFSQSSMLFSQTTTAQELYTKDFATQLPAKSKLYWRVRAKNDKEIGEWSQVWSFKTPAIPKKTTISSPKNKAKVYPTAVMLKWKSMGSKINRYEVQVSSSSTFETTIFSTSDLAGSTPAVYIPDGVLQHSSAYYWRVRGSTPYNLESAWSTPAVFYTLPEAPEPGQPADGEILFTITPVFTWTGVNPSFKYEIHISTRADFKSVALKATSPVGANSLTLTKKLKPEIPYFWRIRTVSKTNGNSSWSQVRKFTIQNTF